MLDGIREPTIKLVCGAFLKVLPLVRAQMATHEARLDRRFTHREEIADIGLNLVNKPMGLDVFQLTRAKGIRQTIRVGKPFLPRKRLFNRDICSYALRPRLAQQSVAFVSKIT